MTCLFYRIQVLANSGIATALVVIVGNLTGWQDKCLDSKDSALVTCLIGGVIGQYACCNGDTWSSELGMLSDAQPRLITTFKVCLFHEFEWFIYFYSLVILYLYFSTRKLYSNFHNHCGQQNLCRNWKWWCLILLSIHIGLYFAAGLVCDIIVLFEAWPSLITDKFCMFVLSGKSFIT